MAESNADVFLELKNSTGEQVKGDCTDKKFPGMIELEDFELSARSMADRQKAEAMEELAESSGEDGGGGGGAPSNIDLRHLENKGEKKKGVFTLKITKHTDSSSPSICLSYAQNLRSEKDCYQSGKLVVRKRGGGGVIFLTVLFKNLYVVNYNLNLSGGKGDSGTSLAEEDIEFVFESCAIKYIQQAKSGRGLAPAITSWSFKDKKSDSGLEGQLKQ